MGEDVDQLLDDIEKREQRLSDWEREFIESVQDQLRRGRSLEAHGLAPAAAASGTPS